MIFLGIFINLLNCLIVEYLGFIRSCWQPKRGLPLLQRPVPSRACGGTGGFGVPLRRVSWPGAAERKGRDQGKLGHAEYHQQPSNLLVRFVILVSRSVLSEWVFVTEWVLVSVSLLLLNECFNNFYEWMSFWLGGAAYCFVMDISESNDLMYIIILFRKSKLVSYYLVIWTGPSQMYPRLTWVEFPTRSLSWAQEAFLLAKLENLITLVRS